MNLTITNRGDVAVPFSSSQGKGFAQVIEPQQAYTLNSEAVTVASVGDNPTFAEEIGDALQALAAVFARLVGTWRKVEPEPHVVHVEIENLGTNSLRVLLGSNVNELQLASGETFVAQATGYVEVRELGV